MDTPDRGAIHHAAELDFTEVQKVTSQVRDVWLQVALSTQPCNRPAAEDAVRAVYHAVGAGAPLITWCDSPRGLTEHFERLRFAGWDWTAVRRNVRLLLTEKLGAESATRLVTFIKGHLNGRALAPDARNLVELSVLADLVLDHLELRPLGLLRPLVAPDRSGWSVWRDAHWLALNECVYRVLGLMQPPLMAAMTWACREAGWWWPGSKGAVIVDHPTVVRRDEQGRPHAAHGPALAWADGLTVHAWRGMRVPAWVVECPTTKRAFAERNTEIRRAALEVIGWDTVIGELGLDPVDVCPDPGNHPHELQLYELPDHINPYGRMVKLLLMVNGSPDRDGRIRRYGETVPARFNCADEAAAWQFGVNPAVYRQVARRT